jgi:hypothetical protein
MIILALNVRRALVHGQGGQLAVGVRVDKSPKIRAKRPSDRLTLPSFFCMVQRCGRRQMKLKRHFYSTIWGHITVFLRRSIRSASFSAARLVILDSGSKRAASIRNSSICPRSESEVSLFGATGAILTESSSLFCPCNMNSPLLKPD